ncbi:MAG: DUF1499 domain-containing protein [Proteobacteria bacterium]|nr:DUF1499 domain-containing protein [Pseudomonadota bacterium]
MSAVRARVRPWARPAFAFLLLLGLSPLLLVLLGAVGSKLGWFGWKVGFGLLSVGWAPKAAFVGLAAGIIAVVLALVVGARRLWLAAVLAVLVPAAVLAGRNGLKTQAAANPVHDVSTDIENPPMASAALLRERGPSANPIERTPRMEVRKGRPELENWADDRVLRISAEICPQARPVVLPEAPAEAEARVQRVLDEVGLEVRRGDELGRVEATHTSTWYGFKDDVIARIEPEGRGSRVDLRSISRVGGSDLGANCARVTRIVEALTAR